MFLPMPEAYPLLIVRKYMLPFVRIVSHRIASFCKIECDENQGSESIDIV